MRRIVASLFSLLLALAGILATAGTAQAAPARYQVLKTIALPHTGSGVAVDSGRGLVYVAMRTNNMVAVYDAGTLELAGQLAVPGEPYNLDIDPASGYVYVTNYAGGSAAPPTPGRLTIVTPRATAIVSSIQVGSGPVGVTRSAYRDVVYVGNSASSSISVVDVSDPTSPELERTITMPAGIETITEMSATSAYAVASQANKVYAVDLSTDQSTEVAAGLNTPHVLQPSAAGNTALITSQGGNSQIIDLNSHARSATFNGESTYYTAADPGTGAIFVTTPWVAGGQVWVLDDQELTIDQQLTALNAYYVAADTTRHRVFVTSINAATMTVLALTPSPPTMLTQPQPVSVVEGESASFTSTASGAPTPSVQWEQSTDDGATFTPVEGATSTTLQFPSVNVDQDGLLVRAVFTNDAGRGISDPARLTVTPLPPVVTQDPEDASADIGTTASFRAAATSSVAPTVQWEVSTDDGATWATLEGATQPTLTLSHLAVAMSGNRYRAVFTNSAGSVNTDSALLTVVEMPPAPPDPDPDPRPEPQPDPAPPSSPPAPGEQAAAGNTSRAATGGTGLAATGSEGMSGLAAMSAAAVIVGIMAAGLARRRST